MQKQGERPMIKDNQKMLNKFHIILDALFIIISYVLSYFLRFNSFLTNFELFNVGEAKYYDILGYVQFLVYLLPGYLIIYAICNLYNPKRNRSHRVQIWDVVKANVLGLLYFAALLYVMKEADISRGFMGSFAFVNITLAIIFRLLLSNLLMYVRKKGFNLKHILIIGYSNATKEYIDRVNANPQWGYRIHGILDDQADRGTVYRNYKVLGSIENLEIILPQNKLDEIVITLSLKEYNKLERIVAMCEKSGVHTKFIPDYYNIIPTKPYTEDLNGLPVINIRNVPLNHFLNKTVKRIVDILGSLFALLLFSIPMIVTALLIKITSKGPIIYSQNRVGLHNREFKMYKFRSMEVQSESAERKAWTKMNDPRVTGIGKFIRKTSIDELPQLINVLKGEMSLVGPRPERPFFVEKFKEEIPRYMIKHQVRPGITGWAQINGYRGDTSIRKRIDHDLFYIENWTLGLDIKILFLTIFKGFINKNAY